MMSHLYTSSPRAPRVSGRSFADKPPGFPEQLARPGDYGDGAPDSAWTWPFFFIFFRFFCFCSDSLENSTAVPYGPPLPGDARTKPLRPLDLEPYSCFGPGRGDDFDDPPHHPPVSADETASMLRARAEGTAVVATTAAALRPLLKFSRAAFADALALRSALPDSAGEYIPIFVDEGASPPLPLGALKKVSARSTAPLSGGAPPPPSSSAASAPATAVAQFTAPAGCVWRATLSMKPPPGVAHIQVLIQPPSPLLPSPPPPSLVLIQPPSPLLPSPPPSTPAFGVLYIALVSIGGITVIGVIGVCAYTATYPQKREVLYNRRP